MLTPTQTIFGLAALTGFISV